MIFMLCTILLFPRYMINTGAKDVSGVWSSVPDSFRILAGTKAEFRWIHTIPGYVEITWYYRGTESHPVLESIMFFSNNKITIPKVGDRHSRLGYNDTVRGSAIMTLDDVRLTDQGDYEAKVVDLKVSDQQGFYIQDVAHMEVIERSSIRFSVGIDNDTYKLSLVNNGTDISLPSRLVPKPYRFNVSVSVDTGVPAPDINMAVVNDGMPYQEPPCKRCNGYTCRRYIDPWFSYDLSSDVPVIHLLIDFRLQNLAVIDIHITVKLAGATPSPSLNVTESGDGCNFITEKDDRIYIAVIVVLSGIVFGLITLFIVLYLKKRIDCTATKEEGHECHEKEHLGESEEQATTV